MKYLYTLPNCAHCQEAKILLAGQDYTEISMTDPLTQFGLMTKIGHVIAPILIKEDKTLWCLAAVNERPSFVRIILD